MIHNLVRWSQANPRRTLRKMRHNSAVLRLAVFSCVVLCSGHSSGQVPAENVDSEHMFFVSEIFEKYGNHNFITYEGFEHLLENLGLGKLEFETKHDVSIHKINGTFLEFHDELSLHKHNHSAHNTKRQTRSLNIDTDDKNNTVNAVKSLRRKCLTAQDILTTYGLKASHEVIISPSEYLQICPAIVYELDQKLCQMEEESGASLRTPEDYHLAWIYASISVFVMGASGLLCVLIVPIVKKSYYRPILEFLISLAVGTLCGDALIHLIPQVYSTNGKPESNLIVISRGTVALLATYIFFIIENILQGIQNQKNENVEDGKEMGKMLGESEEGGHRHGHAHGVKSVAWMAIMGDILHNVTDGLSIGAAFTSSLSSGFAASIAIFCHELPHELGDYAILLSSGMSVKKSLFYNFLSTIFSFGGMIAGIILGEMENAALWINSFTAGSFLYIALSDLVPEMKITQGKTNSRSFIVQTFGLTCGGILMFTIALYEDQIENLLS